MLPKTKHDKDMIDRIGAIYTENKTELLLPIRPSVVYGENHKRQRRDQTYKYSLC